jgi:hypothetical protein
MPARGAVYGRPFGVDVAFTQSCVAGWGLLTLTIRN